MRTIIVLAAILAVALAEGQFYVPRAYYTIDSAGHESLPVPLQRLRRSYNPYPAPPAPWPTGPSSNSAANANAWADAHAQAGSGYIPPPPPYGYGSAAPKH